MTQVVVRRAVPGNKIKRILAQDGRESKEGKASIEVLRGRVAFILARRQRQQAYMAVKKLLIIGISSSRIGLGFWCHLLLIYLASEF